MCYNTLSCLFVISIFKSSGVVALSIGSHGLSSYPATLISIVLKVMIVWWRWVQLTIDYWLIKIEESLACWLFVTISVFLHLAWQWWEPKKTFLTIVVRVNWDCQTHSIRMRGSWVRDLGRLRHYPRVLVRTCPLLWICGTWGRLSLVCLRILSLEVLSRLRWGLFARARIIRTIAYLRAQAAMLKSVDIHTCCVSALLGTTVVTATPVLCLWW